MLLGCYREKKNPPCSMLRKEGLPAHFRRVLGQFCATAGHSVTCKAPAPSALRGEPNHPFLIPYNLPPSAKANS